jgi:F-box-like
MSILNWNSNSAVMLSEDVLLMIFDLLDGYDLLKCESVCRQWRDVLLTGTPWRRVLGRRLNSFFPLFRQAFKKFGMDPSKLDMMEDDVSNNKQLHGREELLKLQIGKNSSQYRDVCKNVLEVKRNWRTAKFTKWTSEKTSKNVSTSRLQMMCDYVAWDVETHNDKKGTSRRGSVFADTTTEPVQITEIRSFRKFMVVDGRGSDHPPFWGGDLGMVRVEIHEPKTDCMVILSIEEWDGYLHHPIHYTGRVLLCYSSRRGIVMGRLRIWKMEHNHLISTPTHDTTRFDVCDLKMDAVDEKFLMATKAGYICEGGNTLHFYDPETFEQVRCLSLCSIGKVYVYERGFLFLRLSSRTTGNVRIMDVASGTWFNNQLQSPFRKKAKEYLSRGSSKSISFNSSVIVIAWEYRDPVERSLLLTNFSVYDFEVVKNASDQNGCCSPLYILQFPLVSTGWALDETRLAFMGSGGPDLTCVGNQLVIVLNFSSTSPLSMGTKKQTTPTEAAAASASTSASSTSGGGAVEVQEAANVEMKVFKDLSFFV